MIEVRVHLHNRAERDILNLALDGIDKLRAQPPATISTVTAPVSQTTPAEVTVPYEADEQGETAEQLVTRYLKEHGMAAATRLLAEYGVKRVGELPPEKRKQLVAALVQK